MRYTNGQLTHVWAQQNESNGQNQNGSFRFCGSELYSYSTMIAKFATDNVVLFTTDKYSVTTSQQMSLARQATTHHKNFDVPCIDIKVGTTHNYSKQRNKEQHRENVTDYKSRVDKLILSASRARSNKDFYNQQALTLCNELNEYIFVFKLRFKPYALPNAEEIKAKAQKEKAAQRRKHLAQLAKTKRDNKERVQKWLAGERVWVPNTISALLRVNGDNIETSQGAIFPVSHGYLALAIIDKCRATKTTFTRNGKQIRLGHFNIDHIDENGTVEAGCHTVGFEAIDRIRSEVLQWREDNKKEVIL